MSRKPISIDIVSKTDQFAKGIDSGVVDPLEEAQETLEDLNKKFEDATDAATDLGHDGSKAADDLTSSLEDAEDAAKDVGKSGSRSTDDLTDALGDAENAAKDMGREVERSAGDAEDALGDAQRATGDLEDGFRDAQNASSDLKAKGGADLSSLGDIIDGDVGGAIEGIAGKVGGLGAAGGPIALAGAALGGIGLKFYESWQENAKKTQEAISDMYADMVQSGQDYLTESFVQEKIKKIIDENSDDMAKAEHISKTLNISIGEAIAAVAGSAEAGSDVMDKLAKKTKENTDAQKEWNETHKVANGELGEEFSQLQKTNTIMSDLADNQNSAANMASKYHNSMTWVGDTNTQIRTQHEELGKVYDSLGDIQDAARNMPTAKVKVSADTTSFDQAIKRLKSGKYRVDVTLATTTRYGQKAV